MQNTTKTLKVGDPAPQFSLRTADAETITLEQYHGTKNVVLLFYPLAWTPV